MELSSGLMVLSLSITVGMGTIIFVSDGLAKKFSKQSFLQEPIRFP